MQDHRIKEHPILEVTQPNRLEFCWLGQPLVAHAGETIASALFANGIRVFGHHHKDNAPQGMFCANGQCAQCMVVANGLPVKSCMVLVEEGMAVEPMDGLPSPPEVKGGSLTMEPVQVLEVECLVIGGGPAGLSAAVELGKAGIRTLVVDDKHRLGGKLVLQTHKFFGSIDDCYAGTRGIDIATRLEDEMAEFENVQVWLNSTALAVFSDRKVGVLHDGHYAVVHPHVLLVATGAREKSLVFKGNTLPGVYGAGAFQTLLNRDLVRASNRLFIVGGGNVGLITGYHALQAGVEVVGLCEVMSDCTGYKVHKDKLVRFGVPIYTSHTILSANGRNQVESVTIAKIDHNWEPVHGSEQSFACDTVLVAVGLDPVDEFTGKAREFGLPVYSAGDAEEIAEASAAMFAGKIRGLEIAKALGRDVGEIPPEWHRTNEILKSKPGAVVVEDIPEAEEGVFPVLHCAQEIPCNPCSTICPQGCIIIGGEDIRGLPEVMNQECIGCEKCVAICPGLAITLVDYRKDADNPVVTVAYEFLSDTIHQGDVVTVLDTEGAILGNVEVVRVRSPKMADRAHLVRVRAPKAIAKQIAGIRVQDEWVSEPLGHYVGRIEDDAMICRCERVTAGEIRALIKQGIRDMNEVKALTRAGMGACGAKTCTPIIRRIFREEGVPADDFVESTQRPVFVEVPLGVFAGVSEGKPPEEAAVVHATDFHEGGL